MHSLSSGSRLARQSMLTDPPRPNVRPVAVDEFQISVAETYDVIVQPNEDRAYTVVPSRNSISERS